MNSPSPSLLMIATRGIPETPSTGRDRMLTFIARSLSGTFALVELRVASVLESFSVVRALRLLLIGARALAVGRPVPIQALVFFDAARMRTIVREVESRPGCSIYLDGVRTVEYARRLRKRFPHIRMVCDLDDLMSRRADELLEKNLPIRIGYLTEFLPLFARNRLLNGPLRRILLRYERGALQRAETDLCLLCESVVLLSDEETSILRRRLGNGASARAITIEPAFAPGTSLSNYPDVTRFIFVGSDMYLQNQLSIDYLLDLWRSIQPARPLHLFGHVTRSYPPIEGVHFEGFAPYEQIYTPGSIALCPAFVKGGVKTKVLEALEFGVIPVGDRISFEGIEPRTALSMPRDEFAAFVKDPLTRLGELLEAGRRLRIALTASQSSHHIAAKWRSAFGARLSTERRTVAPTGATMHGRRVTDVVHCQNS